MIVVTIGSDSRSGSEITESWVTQQINRRRRDGAPLCVVVKINESSLNMTLRTVDCPKLGGSGGRPPNADERRVFERWEKLHLSSPDFTGGNLLAFLKQVA